MKHYCCYSHFVLKCNLTFLLEGACHLQIFIYPNQKPPYLDDFSSKKGEEGGIPGRGTVPCIKRKRNVIIGQLFTCSQIVRYI